MGQALMARIVQQQAEQQVSAAAAEAGVPSNPDAAWWLKLLARALSVIAAGVGLISAILTIVLSITSPACIVAGLLLLILSCVVLVFEVPACCAFFKYAQPIIAFAEKRTYLQKAIIYCASAVVTFLICWGDWGISIFIGCGLIFASGVVYGIMGIGKKGDRDQMMSAAAADGSRQATGAAAPGDLRTGLIYNDDMGRADPSVGQKGPPPGQPEPWAY